MSGTDTNRPLKLAMHQIKRIPMVLLQLVRCLYWMRLVKIATNRSF